MCDSPIRAQLTERRSEAAADTDCTGWQTQRGLHSFWFFITLNSCCSVVVLLGQGLSKSPDILFKEKACLILHSVVWMDVFSQID